MIYFSPDDTDERTLKEAKEVLELYKSGRHVYVTCYDVLDQFLTLAKEEGLEIDLYRKSKPAGVFTGKAEDFHRMRHKYGLRVGEPREELPDFVRAILPPRFGLVFKD